MKLVMSIVYVAVLGVLAHYIGESLPRSRFSETGFFYRARLGKRRCGLRKNRNQEMENTPARYEPHHAGYAAEARYIRRHKRKPHRAYKRNLRCGIYSLLALRFLFRHLPHLEKLYRNYFNVRIYILQYSVYSYSAV